MKVLIIDDDHINNFLCRKVMELSGFSQDVHDCNSVDEGLTYLKSVIAKEPQNFPDILFLDINMPVRSGWDFLEEYKELLEQDALKSMKIYMLSSSVYEEDIERANNNDLISQYVTKPLDKEVLANLS